jgi:hypothetical protein
MTPTERVLRSRDALRGRGGLVTTIRLSPDAAVKIAAMLASGAARNRQDAIEIALAYWREK